MITSAVLLATIPVGASIVTLLISQAHARAMANEERRERASLATVERAFQARENRYVDRRDAVIGLIAAAEDETERVVKFGMDPETGGMSPGDIHDDYMFSTLNAAYARLVVLATSETRSAALELRDAVYDCFHGRKGCWDRYSAALDGFQRTAGVMLSADEQLVEGRNA